VSDSSTPVSPGSRRSDPASSRCAGSRETPASPTARPAATSRPSPGCSPPSPTAASPTSGRTCSRRSAATARWRTAEGGGRNLRERTLPILDALADVIGDGGRARALAIWTHAHGIAVLDLTGALDLAATTAERRTLLRAAVRAHLSSAG
jgi:hypothetical protein